MCRYAIVLTCAEYRNPVLCALDALNDDDARDAAVSLATDWGLSHVQVVTVDTKPPHMARVH